MKAYKLKKRYPSLPEEVKVGTVVTYIRVAKYDKYQDENQNRFSADEIENHPEFWEPSDKYQILEFLYTSADMVEVIYKRQPNTDYFYPSVSFSLSPLSQKDLLHGTGTKVRSVKRLSDGVVFSLGDSIERSKNIYDITNTIKELYPYVEEFNPYDDNDMRTYINSIRVDFGTPTSKAERCGYNRYESLRLLKKVTPEKKFLFKTEDGVSIHEGDPFYIVRKNFTSVSSRPSGFDESHQIKDDDKYFHSYDFAKNYAEGNTVKYSKNMISDALKVFTGNAQFLKSKFWKKLGENS